MRLVRRNVFLVRSAQACVSEEKKYVSGKKKSVSSEKNCLT